MIAFVKGTIAQKGVDHLVVENQGIGWLIFVPGSVIDACGGIDSQIKLHTWLFVREDQMTLYGFLTKDDLDFFKLLITVNGIGPKGALGILSVLSADELRFAILSGDSKTISKAPGIGKKTAEKMIIELKDKLKMPDLEDMVSDREQVSMAASADAKNEAVMALVALGYSQTEAYQALQKVDAAPDMDTETLLKLALKQMMTF